MKIKEIFKGIDCEIFGNDELEIKDIKNDSRKINAQDIFVAIDGINFKGINFLESAKKKGAVACFTDKKYFKELEKDKNFTYVFSKNLLKDLALASKNMYNDSSKDMLVIGITGTKGKTTVATLISKILQYSGKKVFLIGTNGALWNGKQIYDTGRTTLESFENQKLFQKVKKEGADTAVLEVSSQAIIKNRVYGLHFNQTTFTNFGEDHIGKGEHPNLEVYFDAKIAALNLSKINIINLDDKNVRKAKDILKDNKIITFGKDKNADIMFYENSIKKANSYWGFDVEIKIGNEKGRYNIKNKIPGLHSIYNSIAVIANLVNLNIPLQDIFYGLENFTVPGRFKKVENDLNLNIYIDFAHTPDSYENILKTAKTVAAKKLIVVWGADGNRDRTKRPKMAKIVEKYGDVNIIAPCDFYGEETFEEILKDTVKGLTNKEKTIIINDRKKAIEKAIEIMDKEDLVIMLGKGSEEFLLVKGERTPFSEEKIVQNYIKKLAKTGAKT